MIIYDHIWSNMIIFDHIYVITHDHTWSHMDIYDHIWSYMIIYDHSWSYMIMYDQMWSDMVICDHIGQDVIIYRHLWSFTFRYDQFWTILCEGSEPQHPIVSALTFWVSKQKWICFCLTSLNSCKPNGWGYAICSEKADFYGHQLWEGLPAPNIEVSDRMYVIRCWGWAYFDLYNM